MEEDGSQILAQAALDPISRPESTSTTASTSLPQHVLPGISALAAANAATDVTAQLRASAAPSPATMYPTASHAATSGGSGSTMVSLDHVSLSQSHQHLLRERESHSIACHHCIAILSPKPGCVPFFFAAITINLGLSPTIHSVTWLISRPCHARPRQDR
jgi:GATA-binding protein